MNTIILDFDPDMKLQALDTVMDDIDAEIDSMLLSDVHQSDSGCSQSSSPSHSQSTSTYTNRMSSIRVTMVHIITHQFHPYPIKLLKLSIQSQSHTPQSQSITNQPQNQQ